MDPLKHIHQSLDHADEDDRLDMEHFCGALHVSCADRKNPPDRELNQPTGHFYKHTNPVTGELERWITISLKSVPFTINLNAYNTFALRRSQSDEWVGEWEINNGLPPALKKLLGDSENFGLGQYANVNLSLMRHGQAFISGRMWHVVLIGDCEQ